MSFANHPQPSHPFLSLSLRRPPWPLWLALAVALVGGAGLARAQTATISRAALLDKIRGGWAGQMIGVVYGAPTEFRALGKIIEDEIPWRPDKLVEALGQDDLYVEMTFARVMDDMGLNATRRDYGRAFRESQYHLWHANAGARRVLQRGMDAPLSGHPRYNFHANDIDFQIEADFIGLMCPGLPRTSNRLCDRVGRVMNYGDGLYGGMFVCGMYAAAFFENDPRRLVEAGLACIPARSEYGLLIRDVLDWSAQHPGDWRRVWQLVQDKWDKDDPCPDGALRPFNIDAKLNGAYIAIGLLHGGGDFFKTMDISTRCGQDSDCNPSSAVGVLGVALGYEGIPKEFTAPIPAMADRKFDFTDYSFNEIVRSTEARALRAIRDAGGRVTDTEVVVRRQQPRAPRLEQWNPGVPDRRVAVRDAAWNFSGPWEAKDNTRMLTGAPGEATLQFDGVAVVIVGRCHERGGQAEVYLDGRKQKLPLDAYASPRTHDNVLWSTYGLKPGPHTLRIVAPAGSPKEIAINEAVVFRAR